MKVMDTLKYVLSKKLFERFQNGNVRNLATSFEGLDFCSNDYLGFANSLELKSKVFRAYVKEFPVGATGSRLLSGNSQLAMELEEELAIRFNSESALLFCRGQFNFFREQIINHTQPAGSGRPRIISKPGSFRI